MMLVQPQSAVVTALMRYLSSRIQSCYCAPMIWFLAPEGALLSKPPRIALARALNAKSLLIRRMPRALSCDKNGLLRKCFAASHPTGDLR
jgi:hypothetical protein